MKIRKDARTEFYWMIACGIISISYIIFFSIGMSQVKTFPDKRLYIGIGITGKEGTQAVRSADYAIGQFRFLEKLILFLLMTNLLFGKLYIKVIPFSQTTIIPEFSIG